MSCIKTLSVEESNVSDSIIVEGTDPSFNAILSLLCRRSRSTINYPLLGRLYYPPPIETFARISRHYRYRYTITAVTTNMTTVTVSPLCYFKYQRYYRGLKKQCRADRLKIPRFYLWRGSLVFLLYKLPRIMQLTRINLDARR